MERKEQKGGGEGWRSHELPWVPPGMWESCLVWGVWEEAAVGKGGINGDGRRLDLGW